MSAQNNILKVKLLHPAAIVPTKAYAESIG